MFPPPRVPGVSGKHPIIKTGEENTKQQINGREIYRRFGAPAVFLLPPCTPQERHFSQIQENLKNG